MAIERYIIGKALCNIMPQEDQLDKYISDAYDGLLKDGIKKYTSKPSVDDYIKFIITNGEPITNREIITNRENNQAQQMVPGLGERIDAFMKRYAGMSYNQFVDRAKPENIEEGSFGLFKRKSIKRALFESRSRLYLESLCDFEDMGGNIPNILEEIRFIYIPLVKKNKGTEPTFEALYRFLKRFNL